MTPLSSRVVRPAACLVAAAVLLAIVPLLFGSPRPMLRIEWRNVSDADRQALERQWELTTLERREGASRFYAIGDTSETTLRAIITNPAVADTDGVDRGAMRVPNNPRLTDPVGGWLEDAPEWLAGATRLIAYLLILVAVVLFANGVLRESGPSPAATRAVALAFFAATLAWRFLTFTGFTNDHYVHVALAQQFLLGDRPVRDFIDQGWPLMYLLSAAAWRIGGDTLGSEWAIASVGFALGAAFTVIAAARLSRSLLIAAAVTLVEIVALPRSYSYPKVLLYAAAAAAFLALAEHPSRKRIVLMAAIVAIAFLLRHDHGLFIGIASAICVAVASRAEGWRTALRRVARLTAVTGVLLLPWAIFVTTNGGLLAYFQGGLEYSRLERDATQLASLPVFSLYDPFGTVDRAAAWLFWLFWLLPLGCGAALATRLGPGRERWRGEIATLAALVVIAVLVDASFLRQSLDVRLPDAIVPAVLLGAWLLGVAWTAGWRRRSLQWSAQLVALVVLVVSVGAVGVIADLPGQYENANIREGLGGVRSRINQVDGLLASTHRQNLAPPSRYSTALMPFFAYLDRCSSTTDRLIVTGEYPEVLVIAGRRFAGDGVVFGSWYASPTHQDKTLEQLHASPALFVLHMGDYAGFRSRFSLIDDYVQREYQPMADVPVDGADPIRIVVTRNHRAVSVDSETGWPCFSSG